MREIKFRAWDARDQKMTTLIDLGCNEEYGTAWLNPGIKALSDNGLNLMQYTGLKDKNGVEIYEGDILKEDEYGGYWNPGGETHVVEYREGGFYPFLDYPIYAQDLPIPGSTEVIGNIHENPELLEQQ